MEVNHIHVAAGKPQPVIFEKVLGEKPGGGIVPNPDFDIPIGTAVGQDAGVLKPIKAYRLVKANLVGDTTIEIAKGSGIVSGDVIGTAKKSVASTAVDTTNSEKDVVTITLGVALDNGAVLYQSAGVHATQSVPFLTPSYLTGADVYAGKGDQLIKLVNIAVVRKETVNASSEVLALLPTIKAV